MRSLAALFGVFAAVAMAGGCSTVLGLDDLRDRSADGVLDSGPDDAGSGERGAGTSSCSTRRPPTSAPAARGRSHRS